MTDENEQLIRNARGAVFSARVSLRRRESDLRRFEQLDKAQKFIREHGSEIKVSVRFSASAVGGHDDAAEVTGEFLVGDWKDVRRQLIDSIQSEMLDIAERAQ